MRSRNASMSTLANYKEKASKFQRAINLINVIMIIEAIFLINQGKDLFNFYHLGQVDCQSSLIFFTLTFQQLSFWCHYFVWFPSSVCALGVFLFVTAIFSIGVANQPNSNNLSYRILVGLIAVLYSSAFFGAIFMAFCAVKLDASTRIDPTTNSVTEVGPICFCATFECVLCSISSCMARTKLSLMTGTSCSKISGGKFLKSNISFRCCGGEYHDIGNGYAIWKKMEHTDNTSYLNWNPEASKTFNVPDSCCIPNADNADTAEGPVQKGCGLCAYHENPSQCRNNPNAARESRTLEARFLVDLPENIWINSCVYILVGRIKSEVQPYIWYYALAGTGLALEAIIITALASAYITAINRFSGKDN